SQVVWIDDLDQPTGSIVDPAGLVLGRVVKTVGVLDEGAKVIGGTDEGAIARSGKVAAAAGIAGDPKNTAVDGHQLIQAGQAPAGAERFRGAVDYDRRSARDHLTDERAACLADGLAVWHKSPDLDRPGIESGADYRVGDLH